MLTKKQLRQIWNFIWHDDSVYSWIVNIILAFILIKFIVYPSLGFIFQTGFPIVAVVSGSMEHDGNFDTWWNSPAECDGGSCTQGEYYSQYGISRSNFEDYKFQNGFNRGDIMVLYGTKPQNIKKGDVLVFRSQKPDPIIHRVIDMYEDAGVRYFHTKGDHNTRSIISPQLNEVRITDQELVGRAVFRVPLLGYIKIWFVELIVQPLCQLTGAC